MHTNPPRHRHVLGLPALLIAGGLSVALSVQTDLPAQASHASMVEVSVLEESRIVAEGTGYRVVALPGARIAHSEEGVRILEGSAMCLGEGECTIAAGPAVVRSFAGAAHVSFHGNQLAVASISSPALVHVGSALMMVPPGLQWRLTGDALPRAQAGTAMWRHARTLQPLPARFLREQLALLASLPTQDFLPTVAALPPPLAPSTMLLPGAQERRVSDWITGVRGAMRGLVEEGDAEGLQRILEDPGYARVLEGDDGHVFFMILLGRSEPDALATHAILSRAVLREDARLLALFHSRFHAATLSFPAGEQESDDARLATLLLLPEADRTPQALAPFAVQQWERIARVALAQSEAPEALLSVFIEALVPLAQSLDRMGYPERARRWADVLLALTSEHEGILSDADRQQLASFRAFHRVALQASASGDVAVQTFVGEAAVADFSFPAAEVAGRAERALADTGAMFTVETQIEALDGTTARVRSIVFASSTGDQSYTLDFDVRTNTVRRIVRGSEEYPYAISLSEFIAWAKR